MKRCFFVFTAVLFLGSLLVSCSNGDDASNEANGKQEANASPAAKKLANVTFDFSGAKAVAKLEAAVASRAADTDGISGDVVKILDDGSMEDAITVTDEANLADIVAVYESPLPNSGDYFLVFDGISTFKTDGGTVTIGQFICVHEDGSIVDILQVNGGSGESSYIKIKAETVQFDRNGYIYFVSGGASESDSRGEIIYQFDSLENMLTQMVAAVPGTTYRELRVDKAGDYIFVTGNRDRVNFLRAIPVEAPSKHENIYYSSSTQLDDGQWVYDDEAGIIYFCVEYSANQKSYGLYKAEKKDSFYKKTLIGKELGENFKLDLLDSFNHYWKWGACVWNDNVLTDGVLDPQKVINEILLATYCYEYIGQDYTLSAENVDIRFDNEAFKNETNFLRVLYLLTAGKKNEDAIRALDSLVGRTLLQSLKYKVVNYDGTYASGYKGVTNSTYFFSDILYEKGTNTLVKDSNTVFISFKDDQDKLHEIKGKDIFEKDSHVDYQRKGITFVWFDDKDWFVETPCAFAFASQFYYDDGVLNAAKVLDYLFSFCEVSGDKEFRLTAFKNDADYGALYSDKVNEEAIAWLASDVDRMALLSKYFTTLPSATSYLSISSMYYAVFMSFIQKTCFISGTDRKATAWNSGDKLRAISYNNVRELSADTKGVFGVFTDIYDVPTSKTGISANPYFYTVQIADTTGKFIEVETSMPLPSGKIVKTYKDSGRIFMQYSLLDDNGNESGFHTIYALNLEDGTVTDCLEKAPNSSHLEIVSFSAADNKLYYSGVRGTSVENGVVNLVTGEYTPLSITRKMVALYTLKVV